MFSLGFLHIWLIIQKSKQFISVYLEFVLTFNRVLLACVRSLGACPCPRCFIRKEHISGLGTKVDGQRRAKLRKSNQRYQDKIETARKIIYEKGYVVNSKAVDDVIGSESFTPTRVSQAGCLYKHPLTIISQSAFISALSQFGLNFFPLFVVDLMHEFELGVWKAVLTHLIRILYAQGPDIIAEFDYR